MKVSLRVYMSVSLRYLHVGINWPLDEESCPVICCLNAMYMSGTFVHGMLIGMVYIGFVWFSNLILKVE